MTQTELVLAYIDQYGSITARDAMLELGIYRLAARIADLKELGYNIVSTMKYENGRRWAEYGLGHS